MPGRKLSHLPLETSGTAVRGHPRRASLRHLAAGWWLALAAACATAPNEPVPAPSLYLGGDISALARIEQLNGGFRDAGVPGDAITILKAHGSNTFRLRLFVNPSGTDLEINDLAYTIRLAHRIKAAGATFILDLHYSDTWADPDHQTLPAAWTGLAFDALERQVETYTASVMTQMTQAGVRPDIVQIGNEIDNGMLWPAGRVGDGFDTTNQWDNLARLLQAGIKGVRDVVPTSDSTRIMLHLAQGGYPPGTRAFLDQVKSRGVRFDLIGLSFYPWWQGQLADLATNLQSTAQRYGRPVMVVETAYPWRAGGWETLGTDLAADLWPISPSGQVAFLDAIKAAVRAVPNGLGAGIIWWFPEGIAVQRLYAWGGASLTLFDATGNLLPAGAALGGH